MSNALRNPNIDSERGWFSVAMQVGSIRPGGSLETLLNAIKGRG